MKEINLLFIGRFQPLHLGHLKIIQNYHKKGFFIKIGIGSSLDSLKKRNPFSFEERKAMIDLTMKKYKIKDYEVFAIPDSKNNDNLWRKDVKKIVGNFDFLVTGNRWVKNIFSDEAIGVFYYPECKLRFNNIKGSKLRNQNLKDIKNQIPLPVFNYLKNLNSSSP